MKTVQLKTFPHTLQVGASTIKYGCWMICSVLFFKHSLPIPSKIKTIILKLFGATIGSGVVFKPSINIKFPWKLSVGNDCWIGENVWIDNLDKVIMGNDVCISQGALLLSGNHNYKLSTFDLITGKIVLENGCWIGAKSVVCPNVVVQTHAILSVGSVATKNLEAYTIYAGNPAIAIRKRIIE